MTDTNVGGQQAVVAAFTVAMEEQQHWPLQVLVPAGRDVHLVAIHDSARGDRPIQKSGFRFARVSRRHKQETGDSDRHAPREGIHGRPIYMEVAALSKHSGFGDSFRHSC